MKASSKIFWLVVGFVLGWGAAHCFGQAAIPANACTLAREDWTARGSNRSYVYLWSMTGSDEDYAAATLGINCALSRSSSPYKPERVAKGALVGIDLSQLADDLDTAQKVAALWADQAKRDPYFHYQSQLHIAADPKAKTPAKVEPVTITAPWTGEAGAALGVGRIYRLDQFVASALTAVDGGQYLRYRNLTPGKTTLDGYLSSRGAGIKAAELLNAVNQSAQISDVTGQVRGIQMWHGQQSKPSDGAPLVSITNDAFQGKVDPNRNPFLSLLNDSFDAHELILTLANGQQEFTLWDAKGKLLAEAPPNVASDTGVPHPFPERLQCGYSCISCHGKQAGWQPVNNEVLTLLGSGRILTDLSKGTAKQFDALRLIQSRYGARQHDIDSAIISARENLNRRYDELVPSPNAEAAKFAYASATEVINRYQFAWVTPDIAARELGFEPGKDAAATLKAALPAPSPVGAVAEGSAGIMARLQTGLRVTRQEFESGYADFATKAFASIVKEKKQ